MGSVPNYQWHCKKNRIHLVWQVNCKYYEPNKAMSLSRLLFAWCGLTIGVVLYSITPTYGPQFSFRKIFVCRRLVPPWVFCPTSSPGLGRSVNQVTGRLSFLTEFMNFAGTTGRFASGRMLPCWPSGSLFSTSPWKDLIRSDLNQLGLQWNL